MRNIIIATVLCLLVAGAFALSARAQTGTPDTPALPAGIEGWDSEDSAKLLSDPLITARLRKLLGTTDYESFMESFETVVPLKKDGDLLFASGCMIRACTHIESAVAVDLRNKTIHAAIYRDEEPFRFFNERGGKTPGPISAWADRLIELKRPDRGN